MTKAEELAIEHYDADTPGYRLLIMLMNKYGRLVQEAAAKICEETDDAQDDGDDFAERIREMPLP